MREKENIGYAYGSQQGINYFKTTAALRRDRYFWTELGGRFLTSLKTSAFAYRILVLGSTYGA